jgi:hypothetical protein
MNVLSYAAHSPADALSPWRLERREAREEEEKEHGNASFASQFS